MEQQIINNTRENKTVVKPAGKQHLVKKSLK